MGFPFGATLVEMAVTVRSQIVFSTFSHKAFQRRSVWLVCFPGLAGVAGSVVCAGLAGSVALAGFAAWLGSLVRLVRLFRLVWLVGLAGWWLVVGGAPSAYFFSGLARPRA